MSLINILKKSFLFSELEEEYLESIRDIAREKSYRKGDIIFHENQAGDFMFIIEEGIVEVTSVSARGDKKMLALLGEGECFGEMSLFSKLSRSAQTRAFTDCQMCLIHSKDILRVMKNNPDIAMTALKIMSRRLALADREIKSLSFEKIDERVASVILSLLDRFGEKKGNGIEFRIRLTHQLLAEMVGTQREVISRHLKKFSNYGWLSTSMKGITVLNPDALRTFIDERQE